MLLEHFYIVRCISEDSNSLFHRLGVVSTVILTALHSKGHVPESPIAALTIDFESCAHNLATIFQSVRIIGLASRTLCLEADRVKIIGRF